MDTHVRPLRAFALSRVGDLSQGPEVEVLDGATDVASGTGTVEAGSTAVGSPLLKTITVKNLGLTPLTLTGPITTPAGFSVAAGSGSVR